MHRAVHISPLRLFRVNNLSAAFRVLSSTAKGGAADVTAIANPSAILVLLTAVEKRQKRKRRELVSDMVDFPKLKISEPTVLGSKMKTEASSEDICDLSIDKDVTSLSNVGPVVKSKKSAKAKLGNVSDTSSKKDNVSTSNRKLAVETKKKTKAISETPDQSSQSNTKMVEDDIPSNSGTVEKMTPSHIDLESYLRYAETQSLNLSKATVKGTLYEYVAMEVLKSELSLRGALHSGGSYDDGIDISGYWQKQRRHKEPGKTTRLSVLVQCKYSSRTISAKVIRELAGIYDYNTRNSDDQQSTIMVLVAPSLLTPQALAQFSNSSVPIIMCRIESFNPFVYREHSRSSEDVNSASLLRSVSCNSAATRVLDSMGLAIKETQSFSQAWDSRFELVTA
jgi:Protein of unknown function (DUF2034)